MEQIYELAVEILNFFIGKFYLHPYYWLVLIVLSMVNSILLIAYVLTHKKVFLLWGFAGIVTGLFGLVALVMIENTNIVTFADMIRR